jgi:hypothetical protein
MPLLFFWLGPPAMLRDKRQNQKPMTNPNSSARFVTRRTTVSRSK